MNKYDALIDKLIDIIINLLITAKKKGLSYDQVINAINQSREYLKGG